MYHTMRKPLIAVLFALVLVPTGVLAQVLPSPEPTFKGTIGQTYKDS
jgi:hypothetical protein